MLLLIDADITCYSSVAAAEVECEWDEDTWSVYTDMARAKKRFQEWIDKVVEGAGISDFKLCYTGKENFRKAVNPNYKSGRKRKPVGYGALKEWSKEKYPFFEKPQLEADDVMGVLATKFPGKAYPATMDKDLLTIPGKMYHLNQKLEGTWVTSTEADGNYQFLMQTLMGDATDNYGGCPGIGKVGAEKLLKSKGAVWKTVVDAYVKAGLTEDDALMNARMARILRITEWDEEKEEVRLWTPPA
jgi:DNA polymerase-1